MKLTKGKISKILNKKKQSRKKHNKVNKKNKNSNINTFRRKQYLNLANKTFKKSKGGNNIQQGNVDDLQKMLDKSSTDSITPNTTTVEKEQSSSDINSEPSLYPSVTNEFLKSKEKDESQVVSGEEPIVSAQDESQVVSGEEPVVSTQDESQVVSGEEPVVSAQDESQVVSGEEPTVSAQDESQVVTGEEPTVSTTNEPTTKLPENVSESLNEVIDFFTSKIASEITSKLNLNDQYVNQDGFETVKKAAETMRASDNINESRMEGGTKRKKFHLTKKSRKHKTTLEQSLLSTT